MSNWNNPNNRNSNYRSSSSTNNYGQNYGSNSTNYGTEPNDYGPSTSNYNPYSDQNYVEDPGFYLQQNQSYSGNNQSYPNQMYRGSGYTWYNPQFLPQGYQSQQEYVPSYVVQNSTYADPVYNGESSSTQNGQSSSTTNTRKQTPAAGSSNRKNLPQQMQQLNVSGGSGGDRVSNYNDRSHNSSNSGAGRLYRNPNAYYGTTQHPHSPYRSNDSEDRANSAGPDGSKLEDRKKLLAEVATLLNPQEKRHVKTANTTRPDRPDQKEKNRGWASTPNYHAKSSGKKEFRKGDVESRRNENRREPETQRERLTEELTSGKLECLVCCGRLKPVSSVWSCQNCFHVLHLNCVSKWALTSATKTEGVKMRQETSWRCPACQYTYDSIPDKYTCFCTKYLFPKWIKGETPHCCGEVCGKTRKSCTHQCTLLCHPGPCPPCSATVQRDCGCGRTRQSVKCSSTVSIECDLLCNKMLDCGQHDCLEKCHQGPCKPCEKMLKQVCYCGRQEKETTCGSSPQFSCTSPCGRQLNCGKHDCTKPCHPGTCGTCPWDPEKITTCHCGAKNIKRKCCTEPIESCGSKCSVKRAACNHDCPDLCHAGECQPCQVSVTCSCRCGHTSSAATTCHKLNILGEKPTCKKKCTKKRSCAKHKCNQECCNDTVHTCMLLCNKTLSCGQHKCELLCHRGNCPTCTRLSFEEMRCHCGFSVIYPPIDCGTRPPECRQPCSRDHDCSHAPTHSCHSMPECPPCTVLVSRTCYGEHETRKAVPCYIAEYSCGLPCGKPLSCGHRCIERCHGGNCPTQCRQACPSPRDLCGHPCALPCHGDTPCISQSPCSYQVEISCQCGRRKQMTSCAEFRRTWSRQQVSAMVANKDNVAVDPTKIDVKVLECDEECKLYERNLRLAIGLQIANPDLSNKLKPQYNENMRSWAKKDPRFCEMVHKRLTNLVQLAKQSKQKSRSYSFDIMSAAKRQFVHEYCKHFGCESAAYDAEPKRNVVATAYRDKCWLPSYSLLEMIQRECGQRKVPLPTFQRKELISEKTNLSQRESRESVLLPLSKSTPPQPKQSSSTNQPARPPSPHIDYFDFTPSSSNN